MYSDDLQSPSWWLRLCGDGVFRRMGGFAPEILEGVGRVIEGRVGCLQPHVPCWHVIGGCSSPCGGEFLPYRGREWQ